MSQKNILLLLIVFLAACKKEIKDDDKTSYPYTVKATEIVSAQRMYMYTSNGFSNDDEKINAFLKRHGGLVSFKPQPYNQVEFLSKDSARIDLAPDIYKIEQSDTNSFVMRSDVQVMKNAYSSTALQRDLLIYKLNRYNRNLRVIPQSTGPLKEIYKCELGYFGFFRNNLFILPAFTYKLNLYNRAGYFNGFMYGMWNIAFQGELQSRDTLVIQELRIGFSR